MSLELTVIAKNEETTLKEQFLIYEQVTLNPFDDTIMQCIEKTVKKFGVEPEDIVVKITGVYK